MGQGLLDAQSGETSVLSLAPSALIESDRADATGGNAASGAIRALTGQVDDPVIGSITSRGFIDFVPASQFESSFFNGSVSWAELSLNLDYSYGDTTSMVAFDLYSVPSDWLSSEIEADSDISIGTRIASYEIQATSGSVSLPLPAAWVDANDTTLRNSDFSDVFHGFSLVPTGGNAIVGFRFSESQLRVSATPGDTVSFAMSKVASLTDIPPAPNGNILLSDGSSSGMDVQFPIRGGSFDESLVHRVILNLRATNLDASYPTGFNRPLPTVLGMDAVSAEGDTRLEIAEVSINAAGEFVIDNTTLTNVFQSANLGKSVLDRFELYFPPEQSGIGFFVFPTVSGDTSIEALITATPIN